MTKKRKIIIVGYGSIGQRYCRILLEKNQDEIYVFRSKRDGKEIAGVTQLFDWDAVESVRPDIAIIANPTSMHVETALQCAKMNMHLYVEKPLDMSMEQMDLLRDTVRKKKLTLYVAYCLRFHPGIIEAKKIVAEEGFLSANVYCSSLLTNWRPNINHKEVYSSIKAMGGGVLLDLSHEIDYVEYIFGQIQTLVGRCARVSDITVDAEDVAAMVAVMKNGLFAGIYLDFCNVHQERTIKISTKNSFIMVDLISHSISITRDNKVTTKSYALQRDDLYLKQIDYFINNIGNENIMNNLDEASRLLELILSFKSSQGEMR